MVSMSTLLSSRREYKLRGVPLVRARPPLLEEEDEADEEEEEEEEEELLALRYFSNCVCFCVCK